MCDAFQHTANVLPVLYIQRESDTLKMPTFFQSFDFYDNLFYNFYTFNTTHFHMHRAYVVGVYIHIRVSWLLLLQFRS